VASSYLKKQERQRLARRSDMTQLVDSVLSFWFGPAATDAQALERKLERWFQGGKPMDAAIGSQFGTLVEEVLAGKHDAWQDSHDGKLASILVRDQFTRNLYRDTPRAYAGDAGAIRLALQLIDSGADRRYSLEQRIFVITPLLHSEDVNLVARGCALSSEVVADAPTALTAVYARGVDQSLKYLEIVRKFGRFPHRNAILGRASSPEETAFLAQA
jgi:uncharacterized protein (DUF924 family)